MVKSVKTSNKKILAFVKKKECQAASLTPSTLGLMVVSGLVQMQAILGKNIKLIMKFQKALLKQPELHIGSAKRCHFFFHRR